MEEYREWYVEFDDGNFAIVIAKSAADAERFVEETEPGCEIMYGMTMLYEEYEANYLLP